MEKNLIGVTQQPTANLLSVARTGIIQTREERWNWSKAGNHIAIQLSMMSGSGKKWIRLVMTNAGYGRVVRMQTVMGCWGAYKKTESRNIGWCIVTPTFKRMAR